MTVVQSTQAEIAALGGGLEGSALAATALAMAAEIDGANSATSKSMCAKVLMDALKELRALAPPRKQEDAVDEIRRRRERRIARAAG